MRVTHSVIRMSCLGVPRLRIDHVPLTYSGIAYRLGFPFVGGRCGSLGLYCTKMHTAFWLKAQT